LNKILTKEQLLSVAKMENTPAISSLLLSRIIKKSHTSVLGEGRRILAQERGRLAEYSISYREDEESLPSSALILPTSMAKSIAMRLSSSATEGAKIVKRIKGRERYFFESLNKKELIRFIERNCMSFN